MLHVLHHMSYFVQKHGDELLAIVKLIVYTDAFWCVGVPTIGWGLIPDN